MSPVKLFGEDFAILLARYGQDSRGALVENDEKRKALSEERAFGFTASDIGVYCVLRQLCH